MRRREFIVGIGSAVAWPFAARAQQAAVPVVGYISAGTPEIQADAAFRLGLKETGFIEGQNVTVEYRYGQYQTDRWRDLTADLVRRNVAAIAYPGRPQGRAGLPAAQGRRFETETAPIGYVAELLGADTDPERAVRWLIALMVLCCDRSPSL
jgi:putative tryptophan/tyrosine transport system substrate-binding protein